MALKDVVIERRVVALPGGDFTVRGATAFDVEVLMKHFGPELVDTIINVVAATKARPDWSRDYVRNLMIQAVRQIPDVIAALVAVCADEPEQVQTVKRLPTATLIQALLDIFELTFVSETELKKLAAGILRVTETMTGALTTAKLDAKREALGK